jgi:nucleoside-diphosphate-sugar epimerase
MKFAVTGASGFVGRYLCQLLLRQGHQVLRVQRQAASGADVLVLAELAGIESRTDALVGCDAVIHLAGLAHVTEAGAQAGLPYREVNALATAAVGRAALAANVPRVVYISSAGVHGNASADAFSERDTPAPIPLQNTKVSGCCGRRWPAVAPAAPWSARRWW